MNAAPIVDRLAAPLDAARRGALAAATRSRALTVLVGRRDVRVPLLATVQVAALLAVTLARPLWLFVLGPVLLGVPHLASDVRYLVLRRGVARSALVLTAAASALLLGLRLLEVAGVRVPSSLRVEVLVGAAWVALAVALGARERRRGVAWALASLPVLVGLGLYASEHAWTSRLVLAQLHNVVGVAAWLLLFRRNRRAAMAPVAAIVAGTALLASGAALPWALRAGGFEGMGVDLWRVGSMYAPGASPAVAAAAVLVFVFLQAVHYAAWLVWIPQDELPGQGTFTFRMTGRALVRDLGVAGVVVVVAACAGLAGAAAFDARAAVGAYMSLASFHAYLELAMLAYFAARGRVSAPAAA